MHANQLLSTHGLEQLVVGPTHRRGHTLDAVIARSCSSLVSNIHIAPPSISDHSIIHFNIEHDSPPPNAKIVERRSFAKFDSSLFQSDLQGTKLFRLTLLPPSERPNAEELFGLYDSTMVQLINKHTPRKKITIRKKIECPWFDGDCAASKRLTHRLERHFNRVPSAANEDLWRSQVKIKKRLFQQKRCTYLRRSIEEAQGDGRNLWKSLNSLLTPPSEVSPGLSADELLDYFANKTDTIRESTKDAPAPDLSRENPPPHSLIAFDEVTPMDVDKLLSDSSTKQCELDAAPTWLLKTLRGVFALILLYSSMPLSPRQHFPKVINTPSYVHASKNPASTQRTHPATGRFLTFRFSPNSLNVSFIASFLITLSQTTYSHQLNPVLGAITRPKQLF